MKMLSVAVAGAGVVALVLGIAGLLLHHQEICRVTPGGYVRGASALYLLALVIMAYGRCYCTASNPPPAKP